MNEEQLKSHKIELEIREDLKVDSSLSLEENIQAALKPYSESERDSRFSRMEYVSDKVQYEQTLKQGSKEGFVENAKKEKQEVQRATHKQVEDSYANLSWSQKRKLKSRQKDYIKEAKNKGAEGATGLTLPLLTSKQSAEESLNGYVENLSDSERKALKNNAPNPSLFDQHYGNKKQDNLYNDCPYDILTMQQRMQELNYVHGTYSVTRRLDTEDGYPSNLEQYAHYEAQEEIRISLGKAMEALYNANAIPAPELKFLSEEELQEDKNELLKRLIKEYEDTASNFNASVEAQRHAVFQRDRKESMEKLPQNIQDMKDFGRSFAERPAEIDQIRSLMNDPANARLVSQNSQYIKKAWKEYLRTQFTIDEKKVGIKIFDSPQNKTFAPIRNKEIKDVYHFEGMATAFEEILRHLILGEQLSPFADLLALTAISYETDYRREIETQYPNLALNESSVQVRKQIQIAKDQRSNTAMKYLNSLPKAQVNKEMDTRIAVGFLNGWKTDADGNPASDEDRENMERETKWIRDLYGADAEARHRVIDDYVDSLINMEIKPEMLTPEYAMTHYLELNKIIQKTLLLDNVKNGDPEYFKNFSESKKAQINIAAKRALNMSVYTQHNIQFATGLNEGNNYANKESNEHSKSMAEMYKPRVLEDLASYEKRLNEAKFDAETDNFSEAEYINLDKAFLSLSKERFLGKLEKRKKLGLPCDDMGDLFGCCHGMKIADYYQQMADPQFTEKEIEDLKDSGFGGMSVHFDGLDFGSDDMNTVGAAVKTIASGGAAAEEYGCDEETAAEIRKCYDEFRKESLVNGKLKTIVDNVENFNIPFVRAGRMLQGSEENYPQLIAQLQQYQKLADKNSSENCELVLESDKRLRSGAFLDIVRIMAEKNISFIKEQREPLVDYMEDKFANPVKEHLMLVDSNDELLWVNGPMAMEIVTEETLKSQREKLGEGYPAWEQQLRTILEQANADYALMNKFHKVAESYFDEIGEAEHLRDDLQSLDQDRVLAKAKIEEAEKQIIIAQEWMDYANKVRDEDALKDLQEAIEVERDVIEEQKSSGTKPEYLRKPMNEYQKKLTLEWYGKLRMKTYDYQKALKVSKEAQERIEDAKAESAQAELAYQQKKSQIDNPAPLGVNNPVFSKITRKRGFMQYELMQKEGVKEMDYNAKVEEIRNLFN